MQAYTTKPAKDTSNLCCGTCSKSFSRSWLLKNHQRIHTGERPYQCSYCDKAFADKSNLRQHMKIHTTKEKLFQCGICQRTFAQRRYLMKHATEIHRDVSMSLHGTSDDEKKQKSTGPNKYVIQKPQIKVESPSPPETQAEVAMKVTDHRYHTRQKTRNKISAPESSESKYSEQDLKDFIKSNQKTMEKNGYIFIKQNFETLDTDAEPKLTEIGDIPVSALRNCTEFPISEDSVDNKDKALGNQMLKVNGKMVFLKMEEKPIARSEVAKGISGNDAGGNSKVLLQKYFSSKKLVPKQGCGVRRQANILAGSANKRQTKLQTGNSVQYLKIQNLKTPIKGMQPVQIISPIKQPEHVTLVQLVSNQMPFLVPITQVQIQSMSHPIVVNSSILMNSNVQNVTSLSAQTYPNNSFVISDGAVLKSHEPEESTVHIVDEKGAARDVSLQPVSTGSQIVSDAPWQGMLNIKSEHEFLEYLNSHQALSSIETDQGMTILIQNVDSQTGEILDTHNVLANSSVFRDQGAIVSEIVPAVSSVEEVSVDKYDNIDNTMDQSEESENVDNSLSEIKHGTMNRMSPSDEMECDGIKDQSSSDSDQIQCNVMLAEGKLDGDNDDDVEVNKNEHSIQALSDDYLKTVDHRVVLHDHDLYIAQEKSEMDKDGDIEDNVSDCIVEENGSVIDDNIINVSEVSKLNDMIDV